MKLSTIVIVVGALALVRVALPKFRNNITTRSGGANMRGQLQLLASVWDSLTKERKPLDSASIADAGFRAVTPGVYAESSAADAGVRIRLLQADGRGFAAVATHEMLAEDARCGIWIGLATPPVEGAAEAQPRCEKFYEPLLGRERLRRR